MLIYGTRASHLLTEPLAQVTCAACGTHNAIRASVFGRYVHVYWIPLLPLGKVSASECGHCRQVLAGKHMPAELREQVRQLKPRAQAPLWHFAGVALVAVALLVGLLTTHFTQQHTVAYIKQPQAGDLYHVRTGSGYSLLKVTAVQGNSVLLLPNEYQTDTESHLAELDKPSNYEKEPVDITPLDLQIMLHKEQIVGVERP